jgi:exodeoxyribonuclease VII large subunit
VIYPTLVQGPEAPLNIIAALENANREAVVDVILLVRGGGSIEDLWAFNHEQLAYAIAESTLPIVCGVGHETDTTIADFVADLRAPTPTGAAEMAAPRRDQLLAELASFKQGMSQAAQRRLEREAQTLDQYALRLNHAMPNPERMREQIQNLRQRLGQSWMVRTQYWQRHQQHLAAQLEALSPQRTLERGYAVILQQGSGAVRNPDQLLAQHDYRIQLAEGSAEITLAKVKPQ